MYVFFRFDTDDDGRTDHSVWGRYRNGELEARMSRGEPPDEPVPGRIKVWRPSDKSVVISFPSARFGPDINAYKWSSTVSYGDYCPSGGPCIDTAPKRGFIQHTL